MDPNYRADTTRGCRFHRTRLTGSHRDQRLAVTVSLPEVTCTPDRTEPRPLTGGRARDKKHRADRVKSPSDGQTSPTRAARTRCSAARNASAWIVIVG